MLNTDDTIVAVSTAAGTGRRAIVRLSGPQAGALAEKVFAPRVRGPSRDPAHGLARMSGFRWTDGVVRVGSGAAELPARAYVFRKPRSYTRQDVVELHVPGSPAATASLVSRLVDAGARPAGPGEFTARAFFAGRIDLSQAEAVADIVNAADDAQLRSAMDALGGRVGRLCRQTAAKITDALAAVEASIDLADEHIELDRPGDLAERLEEIARETRAVADSAADTAETADRPRAVIAGRPNVGKSSLLNALTGTDRAIVSALAATTRDVLSASMTLGCPVSNAPRAQVAVLVQDVAGFAEAPDSLAAAADSAARRAVAAADVILFVVDSGAKEFGPDRELLDEVRAANPRAPLMLLANKADLLAPDDAPAGIDDLAGPAGAAARAVSAVDGSGLEKLKADLAGLLGLSVDRPGDALGLHARQKRCLHACAAGVRRAAELLAPAAEVADVAELAAVELREALSQVGRISGQVVTEDVLGRIFERFCVGK